ncbi:MAG TPA: MBL fold metallo-hydrolase [Ktedonobacteraceae bacterium]|nr:MBL fold metallo-hydrolase [Ktedonobacteraceae bacterium]
MPPLLSLPAVDGVEITTIMDNSLDVLMASTPVAHRYPLPQDLFERDQLRAEHGASFLITVVNQGRRDTILFDTGVSPDGALHNLDLLGIDLASIQAIVLSHGHTDHTHGLDGFLGRLGRRRMPILLHPDAFLKRRLVYNDGKVLDLPPPSLHDLSREGIELLVERGPSFLVNGTLLVTGQVERTTGFELGVRNQQAEIDGSWQPDPWIYDDQAIVVHVRGKGLVVVTGCGHAGVVNILHQARAQTGIEQVYAVLGGFHLSGAAFEPIIPPTIEELQRIAPAVVVPAHCTGWRAAHAIARAMPEAFVPNSVGTTFALMADEGVG